MKYEYDKERLAIDLVTHRRGRLMNTLREAASQIGVSYSVVQKAEMRLPLSERSFLKICAWLGKEPGAYGSGVSPTDKIETP